MWIVLKSMRAKYYIYKRSVFKFAHEEIFLSIWPNREIMIHNEMSNGTASVTFQANRSAGLTDSASDRFSLRFRFCWQFVDRWLGLPRTGRTTFFSFWYSRHFAGHDDLIHPRIWFDTLNNIYNDIESVVSLEFIKKCPLHVRVSQGLKSTMIV